MELTSENVENVLVSCLFNKGEDSSNAVMIEGVCGKFGFNPKHLNEQEENIISMLEQLPKQFINDGWSFLMACQREDGVHWGEHRDIDNLLCLGIAVGRASILLPRDMWKLFPGGLPYFVVRTDSFHKDAAGPIQKKE